MTSNSIFIGNTKYTGNCQYSKYDELIMARSTYTDVNIDFFENCGINAPRLFVNNVKQGITFDINKCYVNIMHNRNLCFPVQDGTEVTEKYEKGDKIKLHGFYLCKFNKMSDADRSLYRDEECWMLGHNIIKLNLDVTIMKKHVAKKRVNNGDIFKWYKDNMKFSKEQKEAIMELTMYTGYMASYNNCEQTFLNVKCDDEKKGLQLLKGGNFTKTGIVTTKQTLKKRAGLYYYLAILEYVRYQLYCLNDVLKKKYPNYKIKRIYTDSITTNIKCDDEEKLLKSINKELKNNLFSVKIEKKEKMLKPFATNSPKTINIAIDNDSNIEHMPKDIPKLIKEGRSFILTGKAGYGKTHTLKNVIINVCGGR